MTKRVIETPKEKSHNSERKEAELRKKGNRTPKERFLTPKESSHNSEKEISISER